MFFKYFILPFAPSSFESSRILLSSVTIGSSSSQPIRDQVPQDKNAAFSLAQGIAATAHCVS